MEIHHPQNVAELCDIIAAAPQPLSVLGGGTRPIGQSSARCGLSTDLMSGIVTYEPGAMTLVAKSGTSVAEIEAALDLENQCLAFEPMDHRDLLGTQGIPTLGGIIAANVSGPRRIQVGAARDFTLGVSFVDGAGQLLKNGGRVMKNV
ncbi:MAG: FAD-binding protein, partial [Pseudomonadales bacterium]